jgi:copper resistance protein C
MTTPTRTLLHSGLAMAVTTVVGLGAAAVPAAAHAYLLDSSPEDGATVDDPPTEIVLEFNEAIQPDFVQVAVLDEADEPLDVAAPEVAGPVVTQPVTELQPGEYRVSYRVVSADGHPVDGSVSFTVTGAAAEPPAPEPTAEPTAEPTPTPEPTPEPVAGDTAGEPTPTDTPEPAAADGTTSPAVWVGGAALAVAAAVAALYLLRRRPDSGDGE